MLRQTEIRISDLLSPDESPAVEVVNPAGKARICLVCEHASASIPTSLTGLGLAKADRFSHAVWDIGAGALAETLATNLDAPLVRARLSRLVYDCNRPPDADDAIPEQSERIAVPGNRNLSKADRARRIAEIYEVFHEAVATTLGQFDNAPSLVTLHSFTPVWNGAARQTELGLLHDDDERLARAMLEQSDASLRTKLNEPYAAKDGVTHTLRRHANACRLNVMIEVRNDLLSNEQSINRMAEVLTTMLNKAHADLEMAA